MPLAFLISLNEPLRRIIEVAFLAFSLSPDPQGPSSAMSEHHGKGKGYRGGKGKGGRGGSGARSTTIGQNVCVGDHRRSSIRPSVIDLERLMHQRVTVKLTGGREVSGVLKGFDPVPNLVLDECIEYLRDPEDPYKLSGKTRNLGLLVARGTSVVLVCPAAGVTEIDNPFTEESSE